MMLLAMSSVCGNNNGRKIHTAWTSKIHIFDYNFENDCRTLPQIEPQIGH